MNAVALRPVVIKRKHGLPEEGGPVLFKRIFKIKKTVYKREKNREVKKMNLKGRNFLKLLDFTPEEITYLIDLSAELKEKKKKGIRS